MHCVTDYPVDYKYANLNAILTIKKIPHNPDITKHIVTWIGVNEVFFNNFAISLANGLP